jgi:xylulokinase
MDADASGVFFGLRLNHGAAHLARAVMEGVGFALKDCLALVAPGTTEVLLSGGATRSAVWRQTLADIWRVPVHLANEDAPHACTGAAILAGVGTGVYKSVQDAVTLLPDPETVITPYDSTAELYAERYALYRHLYPTLRGDMHWLSKGRTL